MSLRPQTGRIPCRVIAGPLGVGKTTAILEWVGKQAGSKRIAVLVNDFGLAGMDGKIIGDARGRPAIEIISIPGGCLCCTSPAYFEESLARLARPGDVDRILIEPSGLALLAPLKHDLQRMARSLPIVAGPVISMISPVRIKEDHYKTLPFFRQLIDEADCLVANFTDLATDEQMAHFHDWTRRLNPPKTMVIATKNGELPDALLKDDLPVCSHDLEQTDRTVDHQYRPARGSWESDASRIVCRKQLEDLLHNAHRHPAGTGLRRLKGVIRMEQGWRLVQWTEENLNISPFPPQNRSILEWITDKPEDAERFTGHIESACL